MDSETPIIHSLSSETEIDLSISFLSKVFLLGDHMMAHIKATNEDFSTYYGSIKHAYLKKFCYGVFLNGEMRGATLMIEFNNPALFHFKLPKSFEKFDHFFDIACEQNSKFMKIDKCICFMCFGSDLKGVGTLIVRQFIIDFECQNEFSEFYVEASNPVTMIIIRKVLEGKQGWEILKINEMVYEGEIKLDFYLCRFSP